MYFLSCQAHYVNNKKNRLFHKYIDNIRFYVIKITILLFLGRCKLSIFPILSVEIQLK